MKPNVALLAMSWLYAAADPEVNWLRFLETGGIVAIFAYYLFIHEPKVREAEHRRRMEELREMKGEERPPAR